MDKLTCCADRIAGHTSSMHQQTTSSRLDAGWFCKGASILNYNGFESFQKLPSMVFIAMATMVATTAVVVVVTMVVMPTVMVVVTIVVVTIVVVIMVVVIMVAIPTAIVVVIMSTTMVATTCISMQCFDVSKTMFGSTTSSQTKFAIVVTGQHLAILSSTVHE